MAKRPKSDDSDDLLDEGKELFDLCVDSESENRNDAIDDLRFAQLGEQWPVNIQQARQKAGRPTLTINKLKPYIRQVVNDTRLNKPSIKVRPVDSGADIATAKILDGLIRNIQSVSNADIAYDTACEYAVSMGWGYIRVNVDYTHDDSFDKDITIDRVSNPLTIYGDPYSTDADSANWNTAFCVESVPIEEFRTKYPKAEEADWADLAYEIMDAPWRDGDQILLAEWWKREEVMKDLLMLSSGQIMEEDSFLNGKDVFDAHGITVSQQRKIRGWQVRHILMSGAEILENKLWPGKYIPIVPVYGEELNVEGKRYLRSLIRDAKGAQQMVNYWRTATTELIALAPKAPWIGPEEAFDGEDQSKWENANTEMYSFISYKGMTAPQRQAFAGVPAGPLQEALSASDDIMSITGMHGASLGMKSNETSAKAISTRQREGDVNTYHFTDNLSRAIRHVGRIVIDLIPHVYTGPRIIRTIGVQGDVGTIGVNQPIDPATGMPIHVPPGSPQPQAGVPIVVPAPGSMTNGPLPAMVSVPGAGATGGATPPAMPGGPPPPMAAPPGAPSGQPGDTPPGLPAVSGQPGGMEPPSPYVTITPAIYDLTVGKYDIVVESGPSFTTRRAEAAEQMVELIRAFPAAAPIIGDLLVKNFDWPGADEVAARLQKAQAGQDQGPNQQLLQKLAQLQQQNQQLMGRISAMQADKSVDTAKVGVDQHRADTERLETIGDLLPNLSAGLPALLHASGGARSVPASPGGLGLPFRPPRVTPAAWPAPGSGPAFPQ